jgi:hypothetical protein
MSQVATYRICVSTGSTPSIVLYPRNPVQKTLYCWPASLPIVVEYGGSLGLNPPAPEDEDNIINALKRSDRVRSISLTVTNRLLENSSCAISKPLSELEELALMSQESVPMTRPLTSVFQCGARLRRLHLTGITISAILSLLHSSRNLVDLRLYEVSWFSSELHAVVDALSGMTQLQSLSLYLLPFLSYVYPRPPSKPRRSVGLPVLARFSFRGNIGDLEYFVARIYAARLRHIDITLFDGTISELPKLNRFINRIKLHKSHRRADILFSEQAISISLTQPGAPTYLKIELLCEPLALQLSSMAQICTQLSPLLFDVEDLRITGRAIRPIIPEDFHSGLRTNFFAGVKWLHICGFLTTNVLLTLRLLDTRPQTLLPALQKLYIIPEPGLGNTPYSAAIVSFMTSRRRVSDHHITVEYERLRHESELRGEGRVHSTTTTTC